MANDYKPLHISKLFALSEFDNASQDSAKQKWLLEEIKKRDVTVFLKKSHKDQLFITCWSNVLVSVVQILDARGLPSFYTFENLEQMHDKPNPKILENNHELLMELTSLDHLPLAEQVKKLEFNNSLLMFNKDITNENNLSQYQYSQIDDIKDYQEIRIPIFSNAYRYDNSDNQYVKINLTKGNEKNFHSDILFILKNDPISHRVIDKKFHSARNLGSTGINVPLRRGSDNLNLLIQMLLEYLNRPEIDLKRFKSKGFNESMHVHRAGTFVKSYKGLNQADLSNIQIAIQRIDADVLLKLEDIIPNSLFKEIDEVKKKELENIKLEVERVCKGIQYTPSSWTLYEQLIDFKKEVESYLSVMSEYLNVSQIPIDTNNIKCFTPKFTLSSVAVEFSNLYILNRDASELKKELLNVEEFEFDTKFYEPDKNQSGSVRSVICESTSYIFSDDEIRDECYELFSKEFNNLLKLLVDWDEKSGEFEIENPSTERSSVETQCLIKNIYGISGDSNAYKTYEGKLSKYRKRLRIKRDGELSIGMSDEFRHFCSALYVALKNSTPQNIPDKVLKKYMIDNYPTLEFLQEGESSLNSLISLGRKAKSGHNPRKKTR